MREPLEQRRRRAAWARSRASGFQERCLKGSVSLDPSPQVHCRSHPRLRFVCKGSHLMASPALPRVISVGIGFLVELAVLRFASEWACGYGVEGAHIRVRSLCSTRGVFSLARRRAHLRSQPCGVIQRTGLGAVRITCGATPPRSHHLLPDARGCGPRVAYVLLVQGPASGYPLPQRPLAGPASKRGRRRASALWIYGARRKAGPSYCILVSLVSQALSFPCYKGQLRGRVVYWTVQGLRAREARCTT